jgi:(p)ppGpp synthase/HD superfamily hydrolase
VSHLLAVSSLVLEAGGDEDQATAGLLYDMLEDQGARTSYEEIQQLFGGEVARIVRACANTEELPKPPRRDRKIAYLKHLDDADPAVLRLSLADKLHNARSILTDLREHGDDLWKRFNASREDRLGATKGSRQSSRSACPHRSKVT